MRSGNFQFSIPNSHTSHFLALGPQRSTLNPEKAARLAREFAGGIVTIFLDCDLEGVEGIKQCLGYLAQLCPVRLAWTSKMRGGKFKGGPPESLDADEWQRMHGFLVGGGVRS